MAYPNAPNFASSNADSAWWLYHNARTVAPGGAPLSNPPTDVCSTTGASVVRAAKTAVNMSLSPSSQMQPSSVWSDQFQQSLIGKANSIIAGSRSFVRESWYAAWLAEVQRVLARLRQDASARAVSSDSMRWAIYVAYYNEQGMDITNIEMGPGAVLPSWGSTVPGDPDLLRCAEIGRDPLMSGASPGERAVAAQESTSGVRLRPDSFGYQSSASGGNSNLWIGLAVVALFGVLIVKSNA